MVWSRGALPALALAVTCAAALAGDAAASGSPDTGEDAAEPAEQITSYAESVVVTASKLAEQIRDAPVAVTVIKAAEIEQTPADGYADLLRRVPGLNAIQVSARDVNLTPRLASGANARTTLALLDGRTIYQDYFGMVLWDLLPIDFDQIRQIEILRGPGSAMWGANALSGVINIITKDPAELAGTTLRLGGGELGTRRAGVTHAGARGNLGYKVGGSFLSQDAWERPATLPDGTPLPPYDNVGTNQFRTDLRFDLDRREDAGWRFDLGLAESDGVILTRLGPFDSDSLEQGSLGAGYTRGAFRANAYVNYHDARYEGFLTDDVVDIESGSLNLDAGSRWIRGDRHLVVYGGSLRHSQFDISLVPDVHHRNEAGGYIEDEIFLNPKVRVRLGARLDWFDTFGLTVSPRTGVIFDLDPRSTLRISYNRAYVAPSLVENYLVFPSTTVIGLPTGPYVLPFLAEGNEDLEEETIDALEVGYTTVVARRVTVTLSAYASRSKDRIFFVPTAFYTPDAPPPGWPLPPDALLAIPVPSVFSYRNLGEIDDRGAEVAVDVEIVPGLGVYANWSWQDRPEIREEGAIPIVINYPPGHRVNAGLWARRGRYSGALAVNWTDRAFWADVQPLTGWTDSFTMINASFGFDLTERVRWSVKGVNLGDDEIRQHVFGDILRRRIVTELKIRLPGR